MRFLLERMKFALFVVIFIGAGISSIVDAEIVEFWPNATKVLAPNATLTVFCSAIRDIIWKINGSVVNDWDGRYSSDFNFSEAYSRANGSDIWRYNYTIAMKVLPRNNNTQLECLSPDNSGHLESGGKTTLIVAEVPFHTKVCLEILNSTALEVLWQKTFSRKKYPILNYTVNVGIKASANNSSILLEHYYHPVSRDNMEVFIYTREMVSKHCQQLVFSVTAINAIGESTSSEVYGGFPIVPKEVLVKVKDNTFRSNGSPIVKLTFSFPALCSPQTATYIGQLFTSEGKFICQKVYNNTAALTGEWLIESGLEEHQNYIVSVAMKTITGDFSFTFQFDTVHNIAKTGSPSHKVTISVGACMGVITVLVVGLTAILLTLVWTRKYRKQRTVAINPMAQIDATAPTILGMVPNPIYEGPLYETISGMTPHFSNLQKLSKTQESYYVEIVGPNMVAPRPESPTCSKDVANEKRLSNGAAANANTEGEYTYMQPAIPARL